jgi:rod shape determining protein RodA
MVWMLLGYIVAFLIAAVDLRVFERLAYLFYGLVMALLVATKLFGREVNNSTRWIEIGNMVVQPSEFMKIGMILALARYIQRNKRSGKFGLTELIVPTLMIAIPSALVLLQPDLGTTLMIAMVACSMLLFEGIKLRSLLAVMGIVLLVVPVAWQVGVIHDYQKDRVRLWLNPDQFKLDPEGKKVLDKKLQPEQALWAVGSGRLMGKGLRGGARSRLKYLPEMHNDFIIATYAEEHGFVGCAFLTTLFLALAVWMLSVARRARERFGAMLASGVAAMIFSGFFVNIGMVIGLLPVVGVTLPFLSYGGSSILTTFIGIGLVLNVSVSRGKIS